MDFDKLQERVGKLEAWPLAAELERFELPAAKELPRGLIEAVGEQNVFSGNEDRLRHAFGAGSGRGHREARHR